MIVLGIETSCDETAAALVEDGRTVLSSIIATQMDLLNKYGGVVPEIAAREHLTAIAYVVETALKSADVAIRDVSALAVTNGPGLSLAAVTSMAADFCSPWTIGPSSIDPAEST